MTGASPILVAEKLSFTSISTYLRCPKQFYFRYVLGKKSPPSIALIEGSSHHEALQENNLYKKLKGKDLKPKQVTDSFLDTLREKVKAEEAIDWQGEDENGLFRRAKVWHEDYLRDFAPKIKPELIEETFEKAASIDGQSFTIKGVIDLAYSKKCSDYKTITPTGFSRRKREINADLQLSFYSWASGLRKVENICFIKKPNPEVAPIASTRGKAQVGWALKVASDVAKSIASGNFNPCDPTSWQCSPLYCGYHSECRGAY